MILLGVNIDHVATLRQARGGQVPSVLEAASVAEKSGADGITIHLREDRRHIQDDDVYDLRKKIATRLNLEMSVSDEIVTVACDVKPEQATLVPEKRQELTTEGGLDVKTNSAHYGRIVERLAGRGIGVSFFVDPDPEQIRAAGDAGGRIVEIHTGHYSEAKTDSEAADRFKRIVRAVEVGEELKLGISAGHGLNYINVKRFHSLGGIEEYSIGHSIIARAVLVGLDRAVREMIDIVKEIRNVVNDGVDVVFECCGKQEAADQAVEILKPGGKLIIIGIPEFDKWQFSAEKLRRKEITIFQINVYYVRSL